MKKKLLVGTLTLCMLCAACGNASNSQTNKNLDTGSSKQNTKNTASETISENADDPKEADSPKDKDSGITEISIGDAIKTDDFKIKIKNIEFSHDVLPDDTSSFYTHYPAEDGKVYIHIDTNIKNKQKQDAMCDSIMTVTADYNDGYTYKSQPIPEDSGTGFTYANIKAINPLETLGVRYLIDVPEEVETSDKPLFLIFKTGNKEFKYVIR